MMRPTMRGQRPARAASSPTRPAPEWDEHAAHLGWKAFFVPGLKPSAATATQLSRPTIRIGWSRADAAHSGGAKRRRLETSALTLSYGATCCSKPAPPSGHRFDRVKAFWAVSHAVCAPGMPRVENRLSDWLPHDTRERSHIADRNT